MLEQYKPLMSTPNLKEQIMQMAASDVEQLLHIIGDLGYLGYKVSLCKMKGHSLQQCATKFGVSKENARYSWDKCRQKGYDQRLSSMFNLS